MTLDLLVLTWDLLGFDLGLVSAYLGLGAAFGLDLRLISLYF